MNYLLAQLQDPNGQVRIGRYAFITYGDGTMSARQDGSGLMLPIEQTTNTGLKRLLRAIDTMEEEDAVARRLRLDADNAA